MIVLALVLLGLCFGSFVNAFVWRLHELETQPKLSKKKQRELSILHGRSMCVHCWHELAWYDLLPVVSWLSLGGKCRYCRKPISWQYPVVEVAATLLFVWSYLAWPFGLNGFDAYVLLAIWLVFIVAFVVLTVYDLRWLELPNKVVYPLIGLAGVQVLVRLLVTGEDFSVVTGAVWGFVLIGGLFYGLFQLSGGRWIGGGDVKLAFVIGPLVGGAMGAVLVIFLSSLIGTIFSLPMLLKKSLRVNSRIPFGPFLLLATMIVYLYGERLIDWYFGALL